MIVFRRKIDWKNKEMKSRKKLFEIVGVFEKQ